jgi:hypothetical protein
MAGERQSDREGDFSRFPSNSPWARGTAAGSGEVSGWVGRGFFKIVFIVFAICSKRDSQIHPGLNRLRKNSMF